MDSKIERNGNRVTVRIIGDIDHHNVLLLRDTVDREIAAGETKELFVDFTGVDFMDSSGLGFLMGRYKKIAPAGGIIIVVNCNKRIKSILSMSNADKFIKISD